MDGLYAKLPCVRSACSCYLKRLTCMSPTAQSNSAKIHFHATRVMASDNSLPSTIMHGEYSGFVIVALLIVLFSVCTLLVCRSWQRSTRGSCEPKRP